MMRKLFYILFGALALGMLSQADPAPVRPGCDRSAAIEMQAGGANVAAAQFDCTASDEQTCARTYGSDLHLPCPCGQFAGEHAAPVRWRTPRSETVRPTHCRQSAPTAVPDRSTAAGRAGFDPVSGPHPTLHYIIGMRRLII